MKRQGEETEMARVRDWTDLTAGEQNAQVARMMSPSNQIRGAKFAVEYSISQVGDSLDNIVRTLRQTADEIEREHNRADESDNVVGQLIDMASYGTQHAVKWAVNNCGLDSLSHLAAQLAQREVNLQAKRNTIIHCDHKDELVRACSGTVSCGFCGKVIIQNMEEEDDILDREDGS